MNGTLASRRWLFPGILTGAAVLRLGAFFALRSVFDFAAGGALHGSTAYDTYAVNLLSTGILGLTPGTPDAVLPPVYSLLVAGVYRIAGRGALPLVVVNTTLDLVTITCVRRIGRRLFPDGLAVGTVAAAATAFYPYLVFQSLSVSDTSLFTALLFGFLAGAVDLGDPKPMAHPRLTGAAAGVLLGLSMLTRPILAPLVLLVALWLAVHLGLRTALARLVPVALVSALLVGGWTARNSVVFGRLVTVTTNGGSNFWHGNNSQTLAVLREGLDVQWVEPPPVDAADRLGPEADSQFFRLAVEYLGTHRAEIPALLWTKLRVQWSVDISPRVNPSDGSIGIGGPPEGHTPDRAVAAYSQPLFNTYGRAIHRLYWGGLMVLGAIGVWSTRRSWRGVSLVLAVPVALTAVYVAFHPSTRYRAPGDPAWFLFAAAALVRLAPRARERDTVVSDARMRPACCWVGGARYTDPLDASSASKWEALSRLGVPMHVIAFSADGRARTFREHATFHLLPTPAQPVLRAVVAITLAPAALLRAITRDGVRVVFAQSPLEAAVAAVVSFLLRGLGTRLVVVVEGHGDFEEAVFLYRRVPFEALSRRAIAAGARFGLRHADLGRAVSDSVRRQMLHHAPELQIELFPAWIDCDVFGGGARSSPPSSSRDVLFAGALVPAKGLHVLLEAFATLASRVADARLLIAGRSDNAEYVEALHAQIVGLNIEERVTFLGQLTPGDLRGQMQRARVLVLPSITEGLGRVLIEAMLTGTPVIGTHAGGIPEVIADQSTGLLVPSGDDRALAGALVRVFEDSVAIDAMALRARMAAGQLVANDTFVEGHRRLLDAAVQRLAQR